MNPRRSFALVLALSAMSLALSACGGSSSDAAPPAAGGAGSGGAGSGGAGSGGAGSGGGTGATSGGGGGAGSPVADDPIWGDSATICPTAAVDPAAPPLVGADCDPLAPTLCGLPFPSNVYLVDDPAKKTPSGKSIRFGKNTLPQVQGKARIDAMLFSDRDGFSAGSAPLVHFPGATVTGLPTQDTLEASTQADSPTILLEVDSGKLIPHFAELDMSTNKDAERVLMIRPVVRLKDKTRYVVAIRRVVDASGAVIPPSPFFKALRDGTNACAPQLAALRKPLYDEIFGKLASAGVKKDDLQIAWDFATASREANTGDLLALRDDALAKYPDGFKYSIFKVTENPADDPDVWRRIDATIKLPLYLSFSEPYDPMTPTKVPRLMRSPDGKPMQNGEFDFPITIFVPKSAMTAAPASHGLIQNGHGLLGDRLEGAGPENTKGTNFLTKLANQHHYVAFAVYLMGFSGDVDITGKIPVDDTPLVEDALGADPAKLVGLFDRQVQGHLNQLLAMRFMIQNFPSDPNVQVGGKSVIDPSKRFYRGDSQGGIMGGTYMAISPDVTRGLLAEGGMPYSLLLNRSQDWPKFGFLLNGTYGDGRAVQLVMGLVQSLWDRSEPNGFVPYLANDMLPCPSCPNGVTPAHQVLLYDNLGDCQVTPLGAHIMARTVGAKNLKPVARELYGIADADAIPVGGSGLVEWTYGLPDAPQTNQSPAAKYCGGANDPHDKTRQLTPAYQQEDHFFQTGEIIPFCQGVCSCYDAMPEDGCDAVPKPNWMK
jgi:hypothetical protein